MKKIPKTCIPYLSITALFVISRIFFYLFGVRFQPSGDITSPHYLDPLHLKERFFESLFYLHSQPPLFNFLYGLSLKIFPHKYLLFWNIFYLSLGIMLAFATFQLMCALKVQRKLAELLTIAFMLNPALIYLENWFFYSYMVLVLLVLSALFLFRFVESKQSSQGFILFSLLACLVLLRSIFHLFWFVLCIGILMFFCRKEAKKILQLCLIPLLIVFAFYMKNYVIFGKFTLSSTWLGVLSLEMTASEVPLADRIKAYNRGDVSVFADPMVFGTNRPKTFTNEAFTDLNEIQAKKEFLHVKKSRIPVLDQLAKPTSNKINWNSLTHLKISELFRKDALFYLRHYPRAFFITAMNAYLLNFFPGPTDKNFINRQYLFHYENAYNFLFYRLNQINNNYPYFQCNLKILSLQHPTLKWDILSVISFLCVVAVYWAVLIFGLVRGFTAVLEKSDLAWGLCVLYMTGNIVYFTLANVCLSPFANNRYRISLDGFYVTLLGLLLTALLPHVKNSPPNNSS